MPLNDEFTGEILRGTGGFSVPLQAVLPFLCLYRAYLRTHCVLEHRSKSSAGICPDCCQGDICTDLTDRTRGKHIL